MPNHCVSQTFGGTHCELRWLSLEDVYSRANLNKIFSKKYGERCYSQNNGFITNEIANIQKNGKRHFLHSNGILALKR